MVKKKTSRTAATRTESKAMGPCIWGLVLLTIGLYLIVFGFITQTRNPTMFFNWEALLYYIVGIALFGFGKMHKHKA